MARMAREVQGHFVHHGPVARRLTQLYAGLVLYGASAAMILLARVVYHVGVPDRIGSLVFSLLLGAAAFTALGIALTAAIRSAEGASAIVNIIVLPMAFLSGAFGPTRHYPQFLRAIADVLPLTYFIDIVDGVYLDGDSLFADPGALAAVLAWGAAGVLVALARFGWMPRER